MVNRTFHDEDGPFLALGTTLFWGLWGFEHDRERLDGNLRAIAGAGLDYVRVLGAVGPDGWHDRTVDPTVQGWGDRVAAFTDWVHSAHGLRVQWTVFGGVDRTPTPQSRLDTIERFARAIRGRERQVLAVEIANEGWQNGFAGEAGQTELKALAARVRSTYAGLVATTAPSSSDCDAQRAWYGGSRASFVTLHLSRTEPQWKVIDEIATEGRLSCRGVPRAYASNEPIGPYSSVRDERQPLQLAAAAALSWMSGIGAYVLHTGAGIRGGGEDDRRAGRPANIWETEGWRATIDALECVRFTLAPDVPAWSRVRDSAKDHPFEPRGARGALGHHPAAVQGRRFVTLPTEVVRRATLTARRPMTVRVVHPLTCSTLSHRRLARGESLSIAPDPGTVLITGEVE